MSELYGDGSDAMSELNRDGSDDTMSELCKEGSDSYEEQLRALFLSCGAKSDSGLDQSELSDLFQKLELGEERSDELIEHLLNAAGSNTVSFSNFKEGLVAFLAKVPRPPNTPPPCPPTPPRQGREMAPRFVYRNKKYGRKSRPSSVDTSDNEEDGQMTRSKSDPMPSPYEMMTSSYEMVTSSSDKLASPRRNAASQINASNRVEGTDEDVSKGIHVEGISPSDLCLNNEFSDDNLVGSVKDWLRQEERDYIRAIGMDGPGEAEYLLAIWRKLKLGGDGTLDREGLARVCHCVGIDRMSSEMLDNLFAKLDCDRDGKVSFEELLRLFQSEPPHTLSPSPPNHSPRSHNSVPSFPASPTSFPTSPFSPSSPSQIITINTSGQPTFATGLPISPIPDLELSQIKTPEIHKAPPLSRSGSGRKTLNLAGQNTTPPNDSLKQLLEYSLFSILDPDNTGFADSEAIVEYWDGLGVMGGSQVLAELGFGEAMVDLAQLTISLEEEIQQSQDIVKFPSVQAAITTCQHEVRILRSSMDNIAKERDKLKVDLQDANQRASMLAQEVDEQNARMEKSSLQQIHALEQRWGEQVREVQVEAEQEKEVGRREREELSNTITNNVNRFREEEGRLKAELASTQAENGRLERENARLIAKLGETQVLNEDIQKELENLSKMKERLLLLENGAGCISDFGTVDLTKQLEDVTTINKNLKDQNDELILQLEMSRTDKESRPGVTDRLRRSDIRGESNKTDSSTSGVKRRGSLVLDSSLESVSPQESPRVSKVTKFSGPTKSLSGSPQESLSRELEYQLRDISSPPSSIEYVCPGSIGGSGHPLVPKIDIPAPDDSEDAVPQVQREDDTMSREFHREDDNMSTVYLLRNQVQELEQSAANLLNAQEASERERCEDTERLRAHLAEESSALRSKLGEQTRLLQMRLAEAENSFRQVFEENEHLEVSLKESSMVNVNLKKEIKEVEGRMAGVEARLQSALNQLAGESHSPLRRTSTPSNCHSPARKAAPAPPSPAAPPTTCHSPVRITPSPSHTSTTSPGRLGNENIQIIAVRNSDSPREERERSRRGSRTNSPCISKVLVNSDSSLADLNCNNPPDQRMSPTEAKENSHRKTIPSLTRSSSSGPSSLPAYPNLSLKRTRSSADNEKATVQVLQLEQHCQNLEGELDQVKVEIVKILTDKDEFVRENETLKHYALVCSQLREENVAMKRELEGLKLLPPRSPSEKSDTSDQIPDIKIIQHIDRSSPDGQEHDQELLLAPCQLVPINRIQDHDKIEMEKQMEKIKEEKKEMETKVKEMEESLDLMKGEFENMEDYWQGKLDDERKFYENQLKMNEEQFKELEIKMKEYEELLMTSDNSTDRDNEDKLSTIEETVSMEIQVTEWEEEIEQLKNKLEQTEKKHKEEVRKLEAIWVERMEALEKDLVERRQAELEWRLSQGEEQGGGRWEQHCGGEQQQHGDGGEQPSGSRSDHACEECVRRADRGRSVSGGGVGEECVRRADRGRAKITKSASPSPRQTYSDIEQMWKKTIEKDIPKNPRTLSGSGLFQFSPLVPSSPRNGPSSLPIELVNNAHREVKRLQELRRIIQEECDHLLLRKERLREEVGWCGGPIASCHTPHLSGSMSLDEKCQYQEEDEGDLALPCEGGRRSPTATLGSVARAYKVVLQDIEREKAVIQRELERERRSISVPHNNAINDMDFSMINSLRVRLSQQETRSRHLQAALKQQQMQADRILQDTRHQHSAEIGKLEDLVSATQDMVRKQTEKYTDQIEKLAFSNRLIKQIYSENETLVRAIQDLRGLCEDEDMETVVNTVSHVNPANVYPANAPDLVVKIPKPTRTFAVQSFHTQQQ